MSRQNKNKNKKVKKFRISLINDETHKQLWFLKFNRASMTFVVVTIFICFCLTMFALIAYTPIRTFIPGYPNAQTKSLAIKNILVIDSLENEMAKWELYSENVKRVLEGEAPIKLDSLMRKRTEGMTVNNLEYLELKDSLLRDKVNKEDQFEISNTKRRGLQIEGQHFFTPIKGVISQGYDKIIHPYIDITAPAGSSVMAVLDGTVISSSRNDENGYVIQVQHEGDIISIYKHNRTLLKKEGEKVKAGTPIAIMGNSGTLTSGAHLHFELWYKGEAVDPTKYIKF